MSFDDALEALFHELEKEGKDPYHPDFVGLEGFSPREYAETLPRLVSTPLYVLVRDVFLKNGHAVGPDDVWVTLDLPRSYGNVLFYRNGASGRMLPTHLMQLAERDSSVEEKAQLCRHIVRRWARKGGQLTDYVGELASALHPHNSRMVELHAYTKVDENHITTTPYAQVQR